MASLATNPTAMGGGSSGGAGHIATDGLDLTPMVDRGDAVVLAWDPGHAPGNGSMNRFKTVRNHRDTLLRLAVPVGQPKM